MDVTELAISFIDLPGLVGGTLDDDLVDHVVLDLVIYEFHCEF